MGLIVSDPMIANAPPGWAKCNEALKKFTPPAKLGFVCSPGDLNRFSSRYRLAKSFQGLRLDSYATDTIDGYAALLHTFLTYSAFEQFMACCGLNLNGMEPCLNNYNASGCEQDLKKVEGHDVFLRAVMSHLDRQSHREQFEAFLSNQPCNVLYLPAGIRHIFAHGTLTPNAGAGFTMPAKQVCNLLVILLFRVMAGEFVSRLRANGVQA